MAVKQRQSQKQNVNVNINLGEKKRKKKPRKRKTGKKDIKRNETRIIPAYNPPPIINFPPAFNQPPAINLPPPPIPQKQYSVFAEGETATQLGLLSTVPVPLTVEGTTLKEKAKEPKPEAYKVINEPFKAQEEEYQLIEQPLPPPPPPFVEPAPELAPVSGKAQTLTTEERGANALNFILGFDPNQPAEPPSPSTLSTISEGENIRNALRFVEETGQPYTFPSPEQYASLSTPSSPPGFVLNPEFPPALSTISQSLPLPEIPKRTQKGLSAFFPILEGTAPPEQEKKKAGRPKGSTNKPKYEALVPAGQVQFAVPVKETVGQPIFESNVEPPAIFLGGSTEKTFSLEPPENISGRLEKRREAALRKQTGQQETAYNLAPGPPEKISGRLERRRETALTPAEQTVLSNPLGNPLFS
jgi:hypothetical protein